MLRDRGELGLRVGPVRDAEGGWRRLLFPAVHASAGEEGLGSGPTLVAIRSPISARMVTRPCAVTCGGHLADHLRLPEH
jgi:hypothetical protein